GYRRHGRRGSGDLGHHADVPGRAVDVRISLRLYLWGVIAAGITVLAVSMPALVTSRHPYEWALLAALAIATTSFNMNLGTADVSISVADTFFITCALLYGPAAAAAAIA